MSAMCFAESRPARGTRPRPVAASPGPSHAADLLRAGLAARHVGGGYGTVAETPRVSARSPERSGPCDLSLRRDEGCLATEAEAGALQQHSIRPAGELVFRSPACARASNR